MAYDDDPTSVVAQPQAPGMPPAPPVRTPQSRATYWAKELSESKKWLQRFHNLAKKIEQKYLSDGGGDGETGADNSYNVFWSNVQTLLAIVYGRMPEVSVDRANLDPQDDIARVAAMILERIFNIEIKSIDESPFTTYHESIRDLFIAGLGVAWARYDFTAKTATMPPILAPDGRTELAPAVQTQVITDEFAPLDYVRWSDYAMSPARRWNEVRWIGRKVPMSKRALEKRFGAEIAGAVPMGGKHKRGDGGPDDPMRYMASTTCEVWELWDKEEREVCWYVEGFDRTLDSRPDPLGLVAFFPTREPLRSTNLTATFIPRPDWVYLADQYNELNMIAHRLRLLTEALRVVGVYDKANGILERVLGQAAINQMIPVDNWAMFAEKGGIKGVVDWFPLDMVVGALEKLSMRKAELVRDIYEIYGINDVMRGNSVATETATAQRLKAQFGSARIDVRGNMIAGWVTANTRMRAEVICRHWQPDTIMRRSQIDKTGEKPELIAEAVKLLKGAPAEIITRLTVSADAMSSPDWQMEKQQRTEFLQAIAQFIGMAMPLIQTNPGTAPFLMKVLQWAAAGFKSGKAVEGILDEGLNSMAAEAAKPKEPEPPTAEDEKDKAAARKSDADARKALTDAMKNLREMGFDMAQITALMTQPLPGEAPPMQPPGPPGPPEGEQQGPPQGAPPPGNGGMGPMPGARNVPGPGAPQMPPPQGLM